MARIVSGSSFRRLVDITLEFDEGLSTGRVIGGVSVKLKSKAVERLLIDAIDDIGDRIEAEAKDQAPADKDPDAYTWRRRPGPKLKQHPVDRDKDRHLPGSLSHEVVSQEITIADNPHYALFVHEGTDRHGPVHARAMRFKSFGRWYYRKSVAGQAPNPYLERAFFLVNKSYVPIRVAELRAQIKAIT